MAELATFYGRDTSVGQVLHRMRCSGACGGRVGPAWLVTALAPANFHAVGDPRTSTTAMKGALGAILKNLDPIKWNSRRL